MKTTDRHKKDYETPVSVVVGIDTESVLCASLQQLVEDEDYIYNW